VSFGLVSALALPGMLLAWQLTPKSRWIVGAILLCMLALLTVFITERYRLVAVPGLLLFAVFGLSVFWEACASNRPVAIAIYLFVLLLSSLFVAWPQRDPSLWALDAYNSGWQALESQNLSLAEKKLAIAYAYVPTNSETNFALGNLKLAQGQNESASDFYRATLTLDPGHRGALNNLGVLALNAGRYEEAKGWLRHAEELDPGNAKTRYLRARAFLGEHDLENARQEIDCAIGLQPGQPEFAKLRRQIVEQ
jgi:tetratricopeptide (TPR) repeat protein